jgi:DNA polymerase III epsilon subunit-like protein
MPEFIPNTDRAHVVNVMKKTTFLDIETSLVEAYTFRTGMQRINIDQLKEGSQTKLLTAAWGTWHDLYYYGEDGVKSVSNHHRKSAFKKDPLDDTYVLRKLWDVLDQSDIIVAHNAAFDRGWIEGRFMDLGWKQPSKYYVYCTFRTLHGLNGNSKKLDYLSQKLAGTEKVKHDGMSLWIRCAEGDVSAFEEMEEYNIGDIYDTLYQVYMRTALYVNRYKCIDLAGEGLFCSVTGDPLVKQEALYKNRNTALQYYTYINEYYNLEYRDRYNIRSKKAGAGLIRPLIANGVS